MKFLSSILNSFRKEITSLSIVNNECPNCGGRQEYGSEEYKAVQNHLRPSIENQSRKGWI